MPLWLNILIGIALIVSFWLLFAMSLNWITHHGEAKTVPAITGKNIDEVRTFLEDNDFDLVIQDSVYNDTVPPAMVIRQVPEPDAVVKVNRTIYVTINRVIPPEVDMPNLLGYTFRNAEMVLNNMGLKMGDTTFKPDFAKNAVLEQLYQGKNISPGTKIRMGSSISLVIGSGIGAIDLPVPKLVGLTYEEARALIDAHGLILGSVIADPLVSDTATSYVERQNPAPKTERGFQLRIRPGQMIDIWLSREPPASDEPTEQESSEEME